MYKEHLIKEIIKATLQVSNLLSERCSLDEFLKEYNNFYYYEALDGHEADQCQKRAISELGKVVKFHEKIQTEVIDKVYLGDKENLQQYLDAGRITGEQAFEKMKILAECYDIEKLLKKLYKF